MRIKQIVLSYIVLLVFISSCGTPKIITISDKQNAQTALANGDFATAVQAWRIYFEKTPANDVEGSDFASAAKAAFKNGEDEQAVTWFNEARYKNYSDFDMYFITAEIARKQQNISREMTSLDFIVENFPEQKNKVNTRLFEIYNEINETEKALNIWTVMDQEQRGLESNLLLYFNIQKSGSDSVICDLLAAELLKLNPKQEDALKWYAYKYYWLGENRYQQEMATYNDNRTNKQYRILLKELDLSTADFKRALTYLEKLWEIDPGKKYASYFANIYARFGDESKSKTYQKYLE